MTASGFAQELAIFDSKSNTWRPGAPWPTQAILPAAAFDGARLYVAGGRKGPVVLETAWVYDVDANRWQTIASMSRPRWNHSAAALGGYIYVIGGISGTGDQRRSMSEVERYDPASNSWKAVAPLPAPRQAGAVVAALGKIWMFGGRVGAGDQGSASAEVLVYDPAGDSWKTAGRMTRPRVNPVAVAAGEKAVILGGAADGVVVAGADVFDLSGRRAKQAPAPWTPRTGAAALTDGNRLVLAGGAVAQSSSGMSALTEEIDLAALIASKPVK
jgi:N-acetylneuraminic acid mutarotase